MAQLISGTYDSAFYQLIQGALAARGYASLADFLAQEPNYWFNEEEWRQVYDLAPVENPTRIFEQKIGGVNVPVMAAYIADEARGPLMATEGASKETGEIPRMGRGYSFDIAAYEAMQTAQRNGVDINGRVWDRLLMDFGRLTKTVHSQRTFTGYQVESKGSYVTTKVTSGGGLVGFQIDLHPVAANNFKCGGVSLSGYTTQGTKYAWSNASANPLGDLEDLYNQGWRTHLISKDPSKSVFRMSASAYELLKNHATTKAAVAFWKFGPTSGSLSPYRVSDADLAAFMKESLNIPAISVVSYYGFGSVLNKATMKVESVDTEAFDSNTVVLRPAGKFGEIQWKRESNLFATVLSPLYYSEGGAMMYQQDLGQKGVHYEVSSICVPVPYDQKRVLRLAINQAAD
jgi:hypothetical protein